MKVYYPLNCLGAFFLLVLIMSNNAYPENSSKISEKIYKGESSQVNGENLISAATSTSTSTSTSASISTPVSTSITTAYHSPLDPHTEELNLTKSFNLIYADNSQFGLYQLDRFKNELKKYKILLVRGLLSDLGEIPQEKNFGELGEWLVETLHLKEKEDFEILNINSFANVKFNSEIVKEGILTASKPIIIIAHSMGGLDTMLALINNPDLISKVKGIITFQTPFKGSPAADYLHKRKVTRFCMQTILNIKGDISTLENLRTTDREDFLRNNFDALASIINSIPIINIVGYMGAKDKEKIDPKQSTRQVKLMPNPRIHPLYHQGDKADYSLVFPQKPGIYRRIKGWFFSSLISIMNPTFQATALKDKNNPVETDYMVARDDQRLMHSYFINIPYSDHLSYVMAAKYHRKGKEKIKVTVSALELLLGKINFKK